MIKNNEKENYKNINLSNRIGNQLIKIEFSMFKKEKEKLIFIKIKK